jgi:4'-phosphopantetheinyl transferase
MCSQSEVHIHVFRVNPLASAKLYAILSRAECERAEKFVVKDARDLFIAAHCVLRTTLARYLHKDPASLEFRTNRHGKPYLRGREIQFNMSHSHDAIAIAFCHDLVGIDIEYVRQALYSRSLSDSCLTAGERAWLLDQENHEIAFYRIWTLKEAAVKADGRGLSLDCTSVIAVPRGIEQISPITIGSTIWSGMELSSPPGFYLSVVTRTPLETVIGYHYCVP